MEKTPGQHCENSESEGKERSEERSPLSLNPGRSSSSSFKEGSVISLLENNLNENLRYSFSQRRNSTRDQNPLYDKLFSEGDNEDLEANPESNNSSEVHATVNLYLLNKLSAEMGFKKSTVKHVLVNYSSDIGNDIGKAIDFCMFAKENGLDDHLSESESSIEEFNGQNVSSLTTVNRLEMGTIIEEEESKDLLSSEIDQNESSLTMVADNKEEPKSEYSSEDSSDDEAVDPNEETVNCLICYEDHPISRVYSLSCGHQFGISCLRMMFKVGINDGKVLETNCAHYECEKKYTPQDVRSIVKSTRLLEKFDRFRENMEVNMDKNKQWCPYPNCNLWAKGSGWKPKVQCDNGHRFCFICQQDWHRGNCKDALDDKLLDYVSEKGVCRCPKCNIRTEKNSGCNHMTCICGHQWCWLCKGKYSQHHYSYWNVFGCASMQYTEDWNKCKILLYYTLMIFVLMPVFMLFCPVGMMIVGMYDPLRNYDNCCAQFCLIPRAILGYRYRLKCSQILCLTCLYLPFILTFGLLVGVMFFIVLYPIAVAITVWKMIRLIFRDCRCFQKLTY
ncbi:unnamed protein product [Moneuplotes crassus]|uniref:RBR-type E3 ubiquitin transferase n=1 Tax=Euplotes crassus TaxID=5936 RepID=A0AAD2D6R2_EUPCR|nr:unnamed protein product [Moneuplotes crassus]